MRHTTLIFAPLILATIGFAAALHAAADPAAVPTTPQTAGQSKLTGSDGAAPFTICVIGGTTHDNAPMPAYVEAVKWVNAINPDFIVSMGDNVKGTGPVKNQWKLFEETTAGLTKPCFIVAGNHDTQKAGDEWAVRWGPWYHSFVHKGVHCIVLCTDEPGKLGKIDDTQVQWLEAEIAKTPATTRLVFAHTGLWREGSKEMRALWDTRIQPLFEKSGVKAVFGGHHALYEMKRIGSVNYYITQGGGMHGTSANAKKIPPERGGFAHVLRVVVGADGATTVTLHDGSSDKPDIIGLTGAGGKPAAPATNTGN